MGEEGTWNYLTAIAVIALQSSVTLWSAVNSLWIFVQQPWLFVFSCLPLDTLIPLVIIFHPAIETTNGAPVISWRAIVYMYIVRLRVI